MLEKIILFVLLTVSLFELFFDTSRFIYVLKFLMDASFRILNYVLIFFVVLFKNY